MDRYKAAFDLIEKMGYRWSKTSKYPGFEFRVQNSSLENDERSESGASEKYMVMGALQNAGYDAKMLGKTCSVHFVATK